MKERHLIDRIKQYERTLVSPIWGGDKAFEFLCFGHLEMAEAMGFKLEQATPVLRIVKEGQLTDMDGLDVLIAKGYFDDSVIESELEALREMKKKHPDKLCGGGTFGPLTVVSGILGADKMLRMLVKQPEFVERFVDYVTGYMIKLAEAEKKEGQDFFWIAEPLASLLAPARFMRFSGQFIKRIFEASGTPGCLHVCGKTDSHTPYLLETGAECLSIDYCTDIGKCINSVPEDVIIMGNVNPSTLRLGTAEEVREEVRSIYDSCRGHRNFVLSTGCLIMDGTPDENMAVMFERY